MIPRFFCGRMHRRPVLVVLLDWFGWHQELYHMMGERIVRRRWVKAKRPGRSVYTCRKAASHWRATIKPPGTRMVYRVTVKNRVKLSRRPVFRFGKPELVEIPTPSWEIGHHYEFTRWEDI